MRWLRLQLLSGTSATDPISKFWQLGTLSDVDPDIPNLPLEFESGNFGWFRPFDARQPWRARFMPSEAVGPLDQPSAAPAAPPEFGWYFAHPIVPKQKAKPQPDSFVYPWQTPAEAPAVTTLAWHTPFDAPRPLARTKATSQPTFVFPPPVQTLGWLTQFDTPRQTLRRNTGQDPVNVPRPADAQAAQTPSELGWLSPFHQSRMAKPGIALQPVLAPYPYQAVVADNPFGWFVSFPSVKSKARPNEPQAPAFVAQPTAIPPIGWLTSTNPPRSAGRAIPVSQPTFVQPPAPQTLGWLNPSQPIIIQARSRMGEATAFVPQPFSPLPFGWFQSWSVAHRPASIPQIQQPTTIFATQAQSLGWYAAFATRERPVRPVTDRASPATFVSPPIEQSFAWYTQFPVMRPLARPAFDHAWTVSPVFIDPVVHGGTSIIDKRLAQILAAKQRHRDAQARNAKNRHLAEDTEAALLARYKDDPFIPFPLQDAIDQSDDDMLMALMLAL